MLKYLYRIYICAIFIYTNKRKTNDMKTKTELLKEREALTASFQTGNITSLKYVDLYYAIAEKIKRAIY